MSEVGHSEIKEPVRLNFFFFFFFTQPSEASSEEDFYDGFFK